MEVDSELQGIASHHVYSCDYPSSWSASWRCWYRCSSVPAKLSMCIPRRQVIYRVIMRLDEQHYLRTGRWSLR
jgi:hypothetical protein